jgi:AbrB family looped-hinge helix DNA binding protein
MTTVLSEKGELVLPAAIRKSPKIKAGDDFEVGLEGDSVITLRRISKPANSGLLRLLLSCPFPFEIPAREDDCCYRTTASSHLGNA